MGTCCSSRIFLAATTTPASTPTKAMNTSNKGKKWEKWTRRSNKQQLIDNVDGNNEDFHQRYIEDRGIIGRGEFGVVRRIRDRNAPELPLACKYLQKGFTFQDNTLYSPIKPHILRNEVSILRALGGTDFCLQLHSIYESKKTIFIVTELCAVGCSMMEWVSNQPQDLKTEDVSRIAYELLIAINHCATKQVIHRDLKPDNIMFQHPAIHSPLRVIDFGSGTIHQRTSTTDATIRNQDEFFEEDEDEPIHTTFAGSAFYTSPEMFQRTYTSKTDVWSVGVTLYVLVAGYPADNLQHAFNVLHASNNRNLKQQLPNLPQNLPDSYYGVLESCLHYRHKQRKAAKEILNAHQDFLFFHKDYFNNHMTITNDVGETEPIPRTEITSYKYDGKEQEQTTKEEAQPMLPAAADITIQIEHPHRQQQHASSNNSNNQKDEKQPDGTISKDPIAASARNKTASATNNNNSSTSTRTSSVTLEGSVKRHALFLDYIKFERSLTTLLAVILTTKELNQLIKSIQKEVGGTDTDTTTTTETNTPPTIRVNEKEGLKVIQVYALIKILENDIKQPQLVAMIQQLKFSEKYTLFAYHVHLLEGFIRGKGSNQKDDTHTPSHLKRQKTF